MENKLLEVLACPICKGKLDYDKNNNELICKFDKIAFPIKNGVPIMMEKQSRNLNIDED